MVTKARHTAADTGKTDPQPPDLSAALARVEHTDDVVEYTLRVVFALAPADGAAAQPAAANANTVVLQTPPKAATVFNRPARRPVGPGRTW